jgi:hypothetical protein
MVFVEVRLKSLDLLSHMADMRIWLDRNHVDTAGFSYREGNWSGMTRAIARVAFMATTEAEAFAAHFAGRVISDMAPSKAPIARLPTSASATASAPSE